VPKPASPAAPQPAKKLPDSPDKPQKRREDGRGDRWDHKKRGDDERRKIDKIRRKEEEEAKRKAMVETRRKRHEVDESRRKEIAEEAEMSRMIAEEDRAKREAAARKIVIDEATTVREFAEKLRVGANEIIRRLIAKGIMATVNQTLDAEVARELATDMDFEIITRGDDETKKTVKEVEDTAGFLPRSPVVTIMGHVDHGKTSLLDTIRKTSVTATEAGGITQRIGAYSVKLDKGMIVFLDTPGHEAFTAMRARGAAATDIVVLVVAADDGVMPQTVEAIHHAKAAGVPVLVAINKMDKPGANPQRVKEELMAHELVPEEWGGKTIFCEVSAKKNIGIEHLLDMVILQADVLELKADPNRLAYGVIIESKLDKGKGPIATALVQKGTLKVGDPLVAGVHYGKVRALIGDKGNKIESAGPSVPVEVWGFSGVPMAGETFMVTETERRAHQIAVSRLNTEKIESARSKKGHMKLENLHAQISKGDVKELNIIIKADVQGSIEAVKKSMEDLKVEDVRIRVLHGAVGGITETDISLAAASNAIVIGFNVRPSDKARSLAEAEEVDVRLYSIIYAAIDDVKKALEGMLEPVFEERITGRAEVRQVFNVTKVGFIAGSLVISGKITRGSDVRLIRDSVVVYTGKVTSLRRIKDDAREVVAGYECGIGIGYSDIKNGDALETFVSEKVERKGD
jgi:translation initiation factor IF-2